SEMKRVLKPGGVMGVRDIDLGSFIFAGHSAHWLDEYFRIYTNLWSSYGGDGLMGRRLRGLLNEVGMTGVLASASTEYFGSSESVKWMTERMARRIDDTEFVEWVIELGLSDLDSLKSIDAAWDDWSAHPDAFLATTWFEAIGWK
ncbi:MAG: hypothetical protein QF898_09010, partial [SAR202 cluster bacterium]|nr:hypothetical protein [SAR202 cluster bacterium]